MNVVAFKPAPAENSGKPSPSLSAEHLRMLCDAIDFEAAKIDENPGLSSVDATSDGLFAESDDSQPARNYLVTQPGTDRSARVTQLVNLGLMEFAAGPLWRGQYVHTVTAAGRQLIEDFHRALFATR